MHSTTDFLAVEIDTPTTTQILLLEVEGGFPSADVAAAIKFAVEALAGVQRLHFVDTGVKIICAEPDVLHDEVLRAFAAAGFVDGSVRRSHSPN